MDLEAIQQALSGSGFDGWLFYDFRHRDAMAYRILGLDSGGVTTRRWFYFVPAHGEPVKILHRVEPRKLDGLPGREELYMAWTELHAKLKAVLQGHRKVAMQYSPMGDIPYVSVVDAGTVELVRSMGPDVVSSAELVQQFEAVVGDAGYRSHREAGASVQKIKDEAFQLMSDALLRSRQITEYDVREFILSRFAEEGLTSDGEIPIVGFNEHPADPHFEPTRENTHTLHHGDTILIDLWARLEKPGSIFYDITWCGFAGEAPPDLYLEIFGAVCRARDAALELVRQRCSAGHTCTGREVDDAARRVVSDAGYGESFLHRTGHNIGTDVHGTGVNMDNLETKDDRRLVPGICFSIEPGIYLAGRMAARSEIDVFITTNGEVDVFGPIQQRLILIG
jgi:Xaa-Pro aminopeptidase